MNNLASVVKAQEIDFVMASQPYLYRHDLTKAEREKIVFPTLFCRSDQSMADLPSMITGMETFNKASKQIASSHGVLFVDLEKAVPKSLDFFLDDVHYTEEGNRVIGDHLAEQIMASGLITARFPDVSQVQPDSDPSE